jgi:hypothetical protein
MNNEANHIKIPAVYRNIGAMTYEHIMTINNCTDLGYGDAKTVEIIKYMKSTNTRYMNKEALQKYFADDLHPIFKGILSNFGMK